MTPTRSFRTILLATLIVAGAACAEQVVRETQNFARPTDFAVTCFRMDGDTATPVPDAACDPSRHRLFGLVTNTTRGDVAVIDILRRRNIDVIDWMPGFSRAPVGAMPEAIAAHPAGLYAYTANRASADMSRLDTRPEAGFGVVTQALPHHPYDIVIGPDPVTPADNLAAFERYRELAAARPVDGADATETALRRRAWEDDVAAAADVVAWAAFLSAPHDGAVLIVPLGTPSAPPPEGEFGALTPAGMWRIPLVDGAPARLTLSHDGRTLFATHLERPYLSAITITTGAERKVYLSPACSDGIDNDGDGLIDAFDPGCRTPDDDFEGQPEWGPILCNDGIDNDGDGLTDGDDPGCWDPPAIPQCADGIDNDGDGRTDLDDPGCRAWWDDSEDSDAATCADPAAIGTLACPIDPERIARLMPLVAETSCSRLWRADGVGVPPGCLSPFSDGAKPPQCADGIDNDGDGRTDFGPEGEGDPGCFTRDGAFEMDPAPRDLVSMAISPDDRFLYVLDRTAREVLVVRWPEGERLDVLAADSENTPELGARPLLARARGRGIPLATAPQDVGFVATENDGLMAFITEASGRTTLVELRRPGLRCPEDGPDDPYRVPPRETHRLYTADRAGQSFISQPTVLRGDDDIDLAFALIPSLPSMGPFRVQRVTPAEFYGERPDDETVRDEFGEALPDTIACANGITLRHPWVSVRAEEPRIWYGVRLPSPTRLHESETWTVRYEGELPGTRSVGRLTDDEGTFHDPVLDYCARGVEPGDLLVITANERYACGPYDGLMFEWPIEAVSADRLHLGTPGRALVRRGLSEEDVVEATALEVVADDLPLPDLECFAGPLAYAVRPKGQYVVVGSVTGYQHNWRNDGGQCVLRHDADPRFVGRTTEARLSPGTTLATCPPQSDGFEDLYEGAFFENFALRFRMYPGCRRSRDGEVTSLDGEAERDVAWRFNVTSGFTPLQLRTGRLPERVRTLSLPGLRRAFVVDSAGRAIFELDGDYDAATIRYTFF